MPEPDEVKEDPKAITTYTWPAELGRERLRSEVWDSKIWSSHSFRESWNKETTLVARNASNLTDINLSGMPSELLKEFWPGTLPHCTNTKTLVLSNINYLFYHINDPSAAFGTMSSLTALDISNTGFKNEYAQSAIVMLKKLPNLKVLILSKNSLFDGGNYVSSTPNLKELSSVIKRLGHLDLSDMTISPFLITTIFADGIPLRLTLDRCILPNEGMRNLIALLKHSQPNSIVDLRGVDVSLSDWPLLTKLCSSDNPSLTLNLNVGSKVYPGIKALAVKRVSDPIAKFSKSIIDEVNLTNLVLAFCAEDESNFTVNALYPEGTLAIECAEVSGVLNGRYKTYGHYSDKRHNSEDTLPYKAGYQPTGRFQAIEGRRNQAGAVVEVEEASSSLAAAAAAGPSFLDAMLDSSSATPSRESSEESQDALTLVGAEAADNPALN